MNDSTDIYSWMDAVLSGSDSTAYDDNAGANTANAANTSPILTSGNQSQVSPGFWNFLTGAVTAAGTAYAANVGSTQNQNAAQVRTGNSRLLIIGGVIVAAILAGVLILKRK